MLVAPSKRDPNLTTRGHDAAPRGHRGRTGDFRIAGSRQLWTPLLPVVRSRLLISDYRSYSPRTGAGAASWRWRGRGPDPRAIAAVLPPATGMLANASELCGWGGGCRGRSVSGLVRQRPRGRRGSGRWRVLLPRPRAMAPDSMPALWTFRPGAMRPRRCPGAGRIRGLGCRHSTRRRTGVGGRAFHRARRFRRRCRG